MSFCDTCESFCHYEFINEETGNGELFSYCDVKLPPWMNLDYTPPEDRKVEPYDSCDLWKEQK